jgi:hypothetical protein
MKKYLATAVVILITSTAAAQNIRWNQVTPGNMEWANKPSDHGTTTFNQIGPMTFGNDGTRIYNPGYSAAPAARTTPSAGDMLTLSNGNRFLFVTEDQGIEYDSSNKAVRKCFRVADGRTSCVNL